MWPEPDQKELAKYAEEIECRRGGAYLATRDELAAIDDADGSGIATEEMIERAFRPFRGA